MASASAIPDHIAPERVYDFDFYRDPRFTTDVHAAYAAMRDEAPDVFYTPRNGGHWVVTKFDLMSEIVRDPEHFSSRQMQIPPVEGEMTLIPINLDPPDNIPYRQILMPWFAPKSIKKMDEDIKGFATEIIDAVASKGSCDFVSEISARFPVSIFMKIMGLPIRRFDEFRALAVRYFNIQGEAQMVMLAQEIVKLLLEIVDERRTAPEDDLISYLLQAQVHDRPLSDQELGSICFLLFLAGLDTVTNALSFGMRFIAERPDIQATLRSEPEKIDAAVEEVLRLFGPANVPRIVAKDCERFGVSFKKGEMLLNALCVAGRDPDKNADPHTFALEREKRNYLTFSTGPHLCLGNFLARFEMGALFREWFSRIPEFRLGDHYEAHCRGGAVMTLERLDLTWAPSAAT